MNCAKLLRDPRSDLWYHGLSEPWLVYIFPPDKLESSSFATEWNSENLFSTQRSSVSQIIFFAGFTKRKQEWWARGRWDGGNSVMCAQGNRVSFLWKADGGSIRQKQLEQNSPWGSRVATAASSC